MEKALDGLRVSGDGGGGGDGGGIEHVPYVVLAWIAFHGVPVFA
jgi:hypothetical protein